MPSLDPVRVPVVPTTRVRLFSRDGLLCAALLGLAILTTWPVAEIGINDDWSYIRTTQVFAQTHHFVYNGWATAMLGWQILWGALFAWIFGPGFTSIRLSDIPIALLTALLYHAILRRFGLNRQHAIFGTLALTLCPLFLALSDTFMSDIPGLFALLLCLYFCQLALEAEEDSRAVLWLVAAGLTNILLGTVRQISWLGVLVMVPSCGWLLRRRRYIIPATIITWLLGVVSIKFILAWFLRHPYSIPEYGMRGHFGFHAALRMAVELWRSSMSTLLFLLPVLIAFAAAIWPPRKSQVIRAICVFVVLGALYALLNTRDRPDMLVYPWLAGNIITPHGVMQDAPLFGSERHASIASQVLLVAVFVVSLLGFLEAVRAFRRREDQPADRQQRRKMAFLLLPLLIIYCLLLLPRAAFVIVFDRYLLVIMAIVLIYLLKAHQERVSLRIPAIATAALVVMGLLGIAAVHDLFAINRAEVRLLGALEKAGIPRTQIRGGFDFDSITEVETAGYLNDPHLVNPPNSFHPHFGTPDQELPCGYPYLRYVPSLQIKYVISADPTLCLDPADFPKQSYQTWLPPARRELFVGVPSAISPLRQP